MKTSVIVRFLILGILWLALVAFILLHSTVTPYLIFIIIASGIIVFVPMYKKYIRK